MYPPGEDTDDLPTHLTTDVVSLTHTSIESAIIATTYWGDEDAGNCVCVKVRVHRSLLFAERAQPQLGHKN